MRVFKLVSDANQLKYFLTFIHQILETSSFVLETGFNIITALDPPPKTQLEREMT